SSPAPRFDVPTHRVIRVIENDRTPGPAGARNAGASRATGELLAFCDDDDAWHPSKLSMQVRALTGDPAANVATCGLLVKTRDRSFSRVPTRDRLHLTDLVAGRRMEAHT